MGSLIDKLQRLFCSKAAARGQGSGSRSTPSTASGGRSQLSTAAVSSAIATVPRSLAFASRSATWSTVGAAVTLMLISVRQEPGLEWM